MMLHIFALLLALIACNFVHGFSVFEDVSPDQYSRIRLVYGSPIHYRHTKQIGLKINESLVIENVYYGTVSPYSIIWPGHVLNLEIDEVVVESTHISFKPGHDYTAILHDVTPPPTDSEDAFILDNMATISLKDGDPRRIAIVDDNTIEKDSLPRDMAAMRVVQLISDSDIPLPTHANVEKAPLFSSPLSSPTIPSIASSFSSNVLASLHSLIYPPTAPFLSPSSASSSSSSTSTSSEPTLPRALRLPPITITCPPHTRTRVPHALIPPYTSVATTAANTHDANHLTNISENTNGNILLLTGSSECVNCSLYPLTEPIPSGMYVDLTVNTAFPFYLAIAQSLPDDVDVTLTGSIATTNISDRDDFAAKEGTTDNISSPPSSPTANTALSTDSVTTTITRNATAVAWAGERYNVDFSAQEHGIYTVFIIPPSTRAENGVQQPPILIVTTNKVGKWPYYPICYAVLFLSIACLFYQLVLLAYRECVATDSAETAQERFGVLPATITSNPAPLPTHVHNAIAGNYQSRRSPRAGAGASGSGSVNSDAGGNSNGTGAGTGDLSSSPPPSSFATTANNTTVVTATTTSANDLTQPLLLADSMDSAAISPLSTPPPPLLASTSNTHSAQRTHATESDTNTNLSTNATPSTATPGARKPRLLSLDTFRGLTLCLMVFANSGGGGYEILDHAKWHGIYLMDFIFPFFMFMMGVSMCMSFKSLKSKPLSFIVKKIVIRSCKLFLLGLFLNNIGKYQTFRVWGILQRFGVTYLFVSLIALVIPGIHANPGQGVDDLLGADLIRRIHDAKHANDKKTDYSKVYHDSLFHIATNTTNNTHTNTSINSLDYTSPQHNTVDASLTSFDDIHRRHRSRNPSPAPYITTRTRGSITPAADTRTSFSLSAIPPNTNAMQYHHPSNSLAHGNAHTQAYTHTTTPTHTHTLTHTTSSRRTVQSVTRPLLAPHEATVGVTMGVGTDALEYEAALDTSELDAIVAKARGVLSRKGSNSQNLSALGLGVGNHASNSAASGSSTTAPVSTQEYKAIEERYSTPHTPNAVPTANASVVGTAMPGNSTYIPENSSETLAASGMPIPVRSATSTVLTSSTSSSHPSSLPKGLLYDPEADSALHDVMSPAASALVYTGTNTTCTDNAYTGAGDGNHAGSNGSVGAVGVGKGVGEAIDGARTGLTMDANTTRSTLFYSSPSSSSSYSSPLSFTSPKSTLFAPSYSPVSMYHDADDKLSCMDKLLVYWHSRLVPDTNRGFLVTIFQHISMKIQRVLLQLLFSLVEILREVWVFRYQWFLIILFASAWLALTFYLPVPGCPTGYLGGGGVLGDYSAYQDAPLTCTGGAAGYIDSITIGVKHMFQNPTVKEIYQTGAYDPEGLLGCLTSIVCVYIGLVVGRVVVYTNTHKARLGRWFWWMLFTAIATIGCTGFTLDLTHGPVPVNKNLWTLSFVFICSSAATFMMICMYIIIDVWKLWSGKPLFYVGMNSIGIFIMHNILYAKFPFSWTVYGTPQHSELLAMCIHAVVWAIIISYVLYQKKMFFKV